MLLGFNMLFWSDRMTEEHFPIFAEIKRAGFDGIEIPIFGGDPGNFEKIGQVARDNGLRVTAVTVMPDVAHDCISSDPAARAGGTPAHQAGHRLPVRGGRRGAVWPISPAARRLQWGSADAE